MTALLDVQALEKHYYKNVGWFKKQITHALKPLSFTLKQGETLAVTGGASSGKSTLAKVLAGAEPASGGKVYLEGIELNEQSEKLRSSQIRLIFQDPKQSLNPTAKIGSILAAPLKFNTHKSVKDRIDKMRETLLKVGLLPEHIEYYPHMLSTGQLQRVALARAIILDPKVLVLDEAIATLDPSVRAQIINLLLDLQDSQSLSYILITHHLGIIKHISNDILVLDNGEVVEQGPTTSVFSHPEHKYTQQLLASQNF
ncbi:MAG: cationic peptide transport system ATP-binding protein [Phenylobacterium sp.]|jgi:cationic peptide transport system ATP-binding protein